MTSSEHPSLRVTSTTLSTALSEHFKGRRLPGVERTAARNQNEEWQRFGGYAGERRIFRFKEPGDELIGSWQGARKGKFATNGVVAAGGRRNVFNLSTELQALQELDVGSEVRIGSSIINVDNLEDAEKNCARKSIHRKHPSGFTTRGVGVGTGLGLAISYKIIQDHHGTIDAESHVGEGSTFTITLPVNAKQD